jgi:hypothetical protein
MRCQAQADRTPHQERHQQRRQRQFRFHHRTFVYQDSCPSLSSSADSDTNALKPSDAPEASCRDTNSV